MEGHKTHISRYVIFVKRNPLISGRLIANWHHVSSECHPKCQLNYLELCRTFERSSTFVNFVSRLQGLHVQRQNYLTLLFRTELALRPSYRKVFPPAITVFSIHAGCKALHNWLSSKDRHNESGFPFTSLNPAKLDSHHH